MCIFFVILEVDQIVHMCPPNNFFSINFCFEKEKKKQNRNIKNVYIAYNIGRHNILLYK